MKTMDNKPNVAYSRQTSTRAIAAVGLAFLVFLTFVCGIIRHDVPEKKYLRLGKQKQFDCAGDIENRGSCVLVSERYVLSAAHCFIDAETKPDTLDTVIDGKRVSLVAYVPGSASVTDFSKLTATFNGRKVKVKRGIVYPGYLDSLTRGIGDIALLELEQAVTSIEPARMNCTFDELHSNVTGVGYGASGRADKPESVKLEHKKIAGQSVVDSLGGPEIEGQRTLLFCEFVSPQDKTGIHVARPLEYICSGGDSGGGLFRQKGNDWELVGICGGGGGGVDIQLLLKTRSYYGQTMSWTRVSPFIGWITEQMK
jgi:secreted trypsin-like serine protease